MMICRSCQQPMSQELVTAGELVHPNCWCSHGERRGKAHCALCRYESKDPALMDRLAVQGSVFAVAGARGKAGVKIRSNASPTSVAAAMAALPRAGTQKNAILSIIRDAGAAGLTDEQIATLSGLDENTVRPRRVELAEEGWIHLSGEFRKTRHGNDAQVWVVA